MKRAEAEGLACSSAVSEPVAASAGEQGAPVRDDLLECLLLLASAHGQTLTADALRAGLPLESGRLLPSLFERAAARAGFSSRVVSASLEALNAALFPVVLLLSGDRACLLQGWSEDGTRARVVFPELGSTLVEVGRSELAGRYLGHAIYARPSVRFDARAPSVGGARARHWFWSVIAENRGLYRDVLVAALLVNGFALAMPLFVMNVYDRVVPHQALDTLWVLAAGLMVVLVGELVLRSLRGRFVDLASARADVKLSARIMEHVMGMRMAQRPASAGSFAANLRAFESVREFIGSATVVAFVDLPFGLLFVCLIAWIAPAMVLPFAIGVGVLLVYAMLVQRRMHALAQTAYRAGAQRNATLVEGLVGIETLKTLVAEGVIQRRWEWCATLLASVGARLRLLSASATHASSFVQQLVGLAIIVLGVHAIGAGELTTGALIACYLLSSRAMAPVSQVAGLLVQYHTAATALTSLDEMMQQETERPETARFISRGALRGDIEFRGVGFTYPGQEVPALRSVSFSIRAGEKVGILGRVGSGKTTLEKLILGLYQADEGAVLVDGVDVRQLDPAELRRAIGYVQQDVMLFYGSLRDNITLGAPLADDAAVLRAAQIAGIREFVDRHPRGFDMQIGERGESLSGGQRQGVAIARAVVGDPPVLLLDEPTAAMDHSTEEELKRRLGEYARDRTLMLVTHRTSLLDLVDRIIVMDGGRVVADGPKEQVVQALRQGRVGRGA